MGAKKQKHYHFKTQENLFNKNWRYNTVYSKNKYFKKESVEIWHVVILNLMIMNKTFAQKSIINAGKYCPHKQEILYCETLVFRLVFSLDRLQKSKLKWCAKINQKNKLNQ
eukprot:TRINITY_DN24904_c0_g1_i2.p1 TRINITY_DN24904_c0_g1~~TRINITY_DN24904_c0_g1_i2.p1  ORF type:complete len:111 (-),score=1.11 TRINITY_DN24904_c0_g1_i2:155-487(-)